MSVDENTIDPNKHAIRADDVLCHGNQPYADLSDVFASLRNLRDSFYLGPFRNAINVDAKENYFDMIVGRQFIQKWRELKTGHDRQQNQAAAVLTDEIRAIFGFKSLEINSSDDGSTLKLLIDRQSYRLDEMGAGIAQFIVVLANVAARRPGYLLIDEPELNLHPALQHHFLTTLGKYASCATLFSTHNIGLARSVADASYVFRRDKHDQIIARRLEETARLAEILGELSFAGYRELGFRKILLVEGPNDVKTFQALLRKFGKEVPTVVLHLGGSSTIDRRDVDELAEITRLSDDISVVIDSERVGPGAKIAGSRIKFMELCKQLNIKCHILERRAIENYFTSRAVKKALGDNCVALSEYQAIEGKPMGWGKSQGWRIAREMTKDELNGTDLGGFLDKV